MHTHTYTHTHTHTHLCACAAAAHAHTNAVMSPGRTYLYRGGEGGLAAVYMLAWGLELGVKGLVFEV